MVIYGAVNYSVAVLDWFILQKVDIILYVKAPILFFPHATIIIAAALMSSE